MGAAAYNRGSKSLSRQISDEARPVEFVMMADLNAMPKYEDAGRPFGEIAFAHGNGGWWAECPVTGYGFWYRTLREAVRRWNVEIHSYISGRWIASPLPHQHNGTK